MQIWAICVKVNFGIPKLFIEFYLVSTFIKLPVDSFILNIHPCNTVHLFLHIHPIISDNQSIFGL